MKKLLFLIPLLFMAVLPAKAQVYPQPPNVGLAANLPTFCANTGQTYYETDTMTLEYSTVAGTSCTWVAISGGGGGTGNVVGPASSTTSDVSVFGDTTGKLLADGGGPLPATLANANHKWLNSYTLSTGLFTQTQPAISDLTATFSSPLSLSTNTLSCTTCVVASSPGAGIARFAGSTQTVTSSELSGDVTTSGSNAATVVQIEGAAIPASAAFVGTNSSKQLTTSTASQAATLIQGLTGCNTASYVFTPQANDCVAQANSAALTTFSPYTFGINGGAITLSGANAINWQIFVVPSPGITFSKIQFYVATTDSTGGHLYDVCVYNLSGTLLANLGATALTTSGANNISIAQTSVTLTPGAYLLGWTGNATTGQLYAATSQQAWTPYGTSSSTSSSGGACPSTATVPSAGTTFGMGIGLGLSSIFH